MSNVQKNRLLLAAFGFALATVAMTHSLAAQTASSENAQEIALTAVPPRLGDDYSLVVKPGETVQTVIEVRNPSNSTATVETFAKDFYVGSDGETPIPVDGEASSRWALSQWLTLTPNTESIEPRGSATIIVNISVPEDALPGGRYAMILHKPVTSGSQNTGTGAQVNAQVGTLLYVVVSGEVSEAAEVDEFEFTPSFMEMGPANYHLSIRNDSSLHIRPSASIDITNMLGKKVATLSIDEKNIFPDSSRSFDGTWNKTWGFGKYTATVNGMYGTQAQNLTATTTFWILPVRLILAIMLAILLVAVVIFTTRTKYSKMLEEEEEKVRKLDEKLKKARKESKEK